MRKTDTFIMGVLNPISVQKSRVLEITTITFHTTNWTVQSKQLILYKTNWYAYLIFLLLISRLRMQFYPSITELFANDFYQAYSINIVQQFPDLQRVYLGQKMCLSTRERAPRHKKTPSVLSRTLVVRYHMQASLSMLVESWMEIITFMICARSCETPCLEVSIAHIFQARLGFQLYRLQMRTLKERAPNASWTMMPTNPISWHDCFVSYEFILFIIQSDLKQGSQIGMTG